MGNCAQMGPRKMIARNPKGSFREDLEYPCFEAVRILGYQRGQSLDKGVRSPHCPCWQECSF